MFELARPRPGVTIARSRRGHGDRRCPLAAGSGMGRRWIASRSSRSASGRRTTQVEAPVALEDLPGLLAADGDLDHLLHIGDVQARSGRWPRPVDRDGRAPAGPVICSTFTSAAPGTFSSTSAISSPVSSSTSRSSPNTLTATSVRTPGDQLVEAHLDRLGELVVVAGDRSHGLLASPRPGRALARADRATRRGPSA